MAKVKPNKAVGDIVKTYLRQKRQKRCHYTFGEGLR